MIMQGGNLGEHSEEQMIKDDESRAGARDSETPNSGILESKTSNISHSGGSISGNDNGNGNARSVSFAYADGGRQPILNNVINLFQSGAQSLGALLENMFGPESSSGGDNDENNGKNRKILCYCLPCFTFGRGEQGRATVRMVSALVFPIILISFFVLDDLGMTMVRNIRLRNALGRGAIVKHKDYGTTHPVIRRKSINEYPGVRREIIWVPLEHTLSVDGKTSVKAALKCPRGVLFLFHGCTRYAASFFYSPQGSRIVSQAYQAGVAIVVFEKTDEKGCWDWENDGVPVLKIGKKFMMSRVLGACGTDDEGEVKYPPIWAFGASSGGSFIAMLAAKMEEEPEKHKPFLFSALNVQIMDPPEELDWNIPTIFTIMDGDPDTKARVEQRVSTKFQGGPFKTFVTSGQKGVHPNHFSTIYQDDKQMSGQVSRDIHKDLIDMGIIDASSDMLKGDPRASEDAVTSVWEKYDVAVRTAAAASSANSKDVLPFGVYQHLMRPLRPEELYDANSIWLIEELNVAWDQHEITAEGFDEVLTFFFEYGFPQ